MSGFHVVIPARHASTRLPGKMLADLAGKPLVVRVAERAAKSGAASVTVATDHEDIRAAVTACGHNAILTRVDHASGTDRIAEAALLLKLPADAAIVNVQGDEPLIDPELIAAVAALLERNPAAAIATACHAIDDAAEFFNPNVVKVVLNARGSAHYFSRAPLPWARDAFAASRAALPAGLPCYRHVGIYAFRGDFLAQFSKLAPSPLEQWEALEQLRALWHGHEIVVSVCRDAPHAGVDTPEDLARVRKIFAGRAA